MRLVTHADADDCVSGQISSGLKGSTGISTDGAHFPHVGQSPYGAPLLSGTEKQHQLSPPRELISPTCLKTFFVSAG